MTDIQADLRGKWENSARSSLSEEATSLLRWEQLKKALQSKRNKALSLRTCVEEIVFTFTYPRIDLEVSKQMNHLLKAPFCVHPKTGRVCVPIDPNNCDEFDPLAVPTLSQLIEEINSGGLRMDVDDDDSDSSLLGKSIKFFRSSFLEPLLKSCKEEIESSYKTKIAKTKDSFSW
jgi:DNA primase small subunit